MTSKEALKYLLVNSEELFSVYEEDISFYLDAKKLYNIVLKDLERLEKLEKVIDFLKLNFDMTLDSKLRISDGSECVQTFITYLPENTTIDEMFEVLKEVLENENKDTNNI